MTKFYTLVTDSIIRKWEKFHKLTTEMTKLRCF